MGCVVAIYARIYCVIKKYEFSRTLMFFDSAIFSTPASRCKHQQNKAEEIRGFQIDDYRFQRALDFKNLKGQVYHHPGIRNKYNLFLSVGMLFFFK